MAAATTNPTESRARRPLLALSATRLRLFFREPVTLPTLAGAVLIVLGCWIAAPRKRPEQSAA